MNTEQEIVDQQLNEGEVIGAENEIELEEGMDKIKIISGNKDLTSTTFQLKEEDHTLGNALRWTVAKDQKVEYVGYSIPHPSEPLLNFRIQTFNDTTSVRAMEDGLDNLIAISKHINDQFIQEMEKKEYEVCEDELFLVSRKRESKLNEDVME
ncbi:RBP11-like subunits of RNA polymerase [Neoconidiobolus thromboides FSU 785]|nr:RBP11-like subunits of RNA polymerase [Neoconidiobolus thromboides FSU 785]